MTSTNMFLEILHIPRFRWIAVNTLGNKDFKKISVLSKEIQTAFKEKPELSFFLDKKAIDNYLNGRDGKKPNEEHYDANWIFLIRARYGTYLRYTDLGWEDSSTEIQDCLKSGNYKRVNEMLRDLVVRSKTNAVGDKAAGNNRLRYRDPSNANYYPTYWMILRYAIEKKADEVVEEYFRLLDSPQYSNNLGGGCAMAEALYAAIKMKNNDLIKTLNTRYSRYIYYD